MSTLPDAIDAIDPGTRANAAEAIVFLRLLRPEGPWVLTAIEPNRKGIKTCTFASGQVDQLVAFHAKWNGKWNLYYDPNPLLRPVSKKSQKSDIKSCAVFHVDIDPRAGEDLKDERERIRVLVHGKPPLGIPAPSFIILSTAEQNGATAAA